MNITQSLETTEKLALTIEEMAKMLCIGTNKAYELTRTISFPVLKIGRRLIVPVEELKSWIKENLRKEIK